MADTDDDFLDDPNLRKLGSAVARLSPEEPPADLVSRTLCRISQRCEPVKKVFFLIRPITSPLARLAAAAVIIFALSPMLDMTVAEKLGSRIESRIGAKATDRIELFVDSLLTRNGIPGYTQDDLDATIGVPRPVFTPVRQKQALRPKSS